MGTDETDVECGDNGIAFGEKMDFAQTSPIPNTGISNPSSSQVPPQFKPLTYLEKRFLLAVERGDLASVRRYSRRR